jgi:hypothetical protein
MYLTAKYAIYGNPLVNAPHIVGDGHDPAALIPELLDRLVSLGQLAQQISLSLGGNGHR